MAEDTPNAAPGGEPAPPEPTPPVSPPEASASTAPAPPPPAEATAPAGNASEAASLDSLDQLSIEELLKQANFEDAASAGGTPAGGEMNNPAPGAEGFKFPAFQQALQDAHVSSIDLLRDVELNVKIELGRSRMLVEDVLKLSEGSVVELDKLAGDPVDVFVNDRLVARGEVLVLNDNFCVRVNEIVAGVKEEGL
jgi:flagellar motor switch protein FliN/FliY